MRVAQLSVAFIGLSLCTLAAADPLPLRNLNPLLAGYELPPALPAKSPEGTSLSAQFAISNISLDQYSAHEAVQLDGEVQRWQLNFATSLSDSLGLRVELPYLQISGGHLDHFIESFHRTFGMPNGNRSEWPTNRLLIQHQRDGVTDFNLTESQRGIGDLTLRMSQRLGHASADEKFNNTLWLSLKLPTGNANKLTGSGSIDAALSFAASQQLSDSFTTTQQVSLSLLGKGDRLRDQQKTTVWSGSVGIDAKVTQHWSAVLQLDGSTKALASEVRALGPALQLTVGPRYESGAWRSELVISEDIAVDTAPDVQFQLDIARKW